MSGRRPADHPVLRALRDICGEGFARAAGPADTVAGRQAGFVAVPGSAEAVAALLRLAHDNGHAVTPRGAGTKIDWGAPPLRVDLLLDTGRLAGVRRSDGAEPTAEVGAGTPVRAVQAALARTGQRLAVDPPSPGATLGGVLVADEAGPLRHRFGPPTDQLIGVRCVGPDGRLTAAGLHEGPPGERWVGTGGVLVSATVRVTDNPAGQVWVTRPVWTPLEVHELVGRVSPAFAPVGVEVDLPVPGRRSAAGPGGGSGTFAVLLEGDPADLAGRARGLAAALGGDSTVASAAPDWWGRYPFTAEQVAVRISVPIADLHAAVYALSDAAGAAVPVRGSAGSGVVHAALPGDLSPQRVTEIMEAVRGVLLARGGRCVVVAAPQGLRHALDMEDVTDPD